MLEEHALQLIQDSLSSLRRAGLVEQEVQVRDETILLGAGSPLDSIAFVTFVTDLEDRLNRASDQELFLVLNDIHEFNPDSLFLSAGTLARYIVKLTGDQVVRHD